MQIAPGLWLKNRIIGWLSADRPACKTPVCDFERICYEIKLCDVLLIEGSSHISNVIKTVTQSNWSHSVLYIGKLHDIDDPQLRKQVKRSYQGNTGDPLILEALLGQGTVVSSIHKYRKDNLRICRPRGLTPADARDIVAYSIHKLGNHYDVRQILDLARFLFPYSLLPRRWRSSLFQHKPGQETRTVCSSLIVAAFQQVKFPVLPVVERTENGGFRLYRRNIRLFSPSDFDYSPYFDVIKYPYLDYGDRPLYQKLPWNEDIECNASGDCYRSGKNGKNNYSDTVNIKES